MVHVTIDGNLIQLRTPFAYKNKCTAIPGGRWVAKKRCWEYLLTPVTAMTIMQVFGKELPEQIHDFLEPLRDRVIQCQAIKKELIDMTVPETRTEPWHHQVVTWNMAKKILGLDEDHSIGGGFLVGLDMGCGKSKIAVDLVSNYRNKIKQILVVSPNSAIEVWTGNESITGQFYRHTLDSQYSSMHVVPVTKKVPIEKKTKNAELARQVAHHQGKQFILVINYESAWREPFAGWAKEVGFDIIIADEVHRIKMPSGRASKFFARLAHHSKYRLGLTGTPLPHSPLDAFGQYRYLDPGVFGTIYGKFRAEYANMGGFEGRQAVSYKNLEQLHDKMFLIAHRVMSEDMFDLPPFIDEVRTMDLSPEERKIYDQMDKDFCVLLGEDIIQANNALVKLLRLQEITSGFLNGVQIGDSKKRLLADVMEDFELEEPIVVFARFTNDLAMIREVAESQGRTYAELSGQHNELGKWQGGKADVLGVQIQSGKEGVDFTRARYNIYYSLGFSLGDYEQSRRRTNRPGQAREGMYIQLIANHSVDTKVMKSLQAHKEVVEDVLNQYKETL